jgi:hypothetical protein
VPSAVLTSSTATLRRLLPSHAAFDDRGDAKRIGDGANTRPCPERKRRRASWT